MTPPLERWLAEVEKRSEAATKGPWSVEYDAETWDGDFYAQSWVETKVDTWCPVQSNSTADQMLDQRETAEFIAHSRTDLPTLVKLLRKAIEQRDEQIKHFNRHDEESINHYNRSLTQIISDTLGSDHE